MLETYSEATLNNCYFEGNEAVDNRGSIYIKIRSKIILINSALKLNKAKNSGGSILIGHSQAIIDSCTVSNELVVLGYGGAISAENVANATVKESSFDNCVGSYGGSLSVKSESTLKLEHTNITNSFAINDGGGLFIFQNSFVIGHNTSFVDGQSTFGGGFLVDESSEINLKIFHFFGNSGSVSGGAIFCKKGERNYFSYYAKENGGGIFGDNCHMMFDYIQIVNNTASNSGGGMYLETSAVEIHNSDAVNNSASYSGNFGLVKMNSKFKSNYLHLLQAEKSCSEIEMTHTFLLNLETNCTFDAESDSQIRLDSIYYTEISESNENIVCTDDTSKAQRIFEDQFILYL